MELGWGQLSRSHTNTSFFPCQRKTIFAKHQFLDKQKRIYWIEQQCENLLDNQVQKIIVNLQSIKPQTTQAHEAKEKAINYYIGHEDQMKYKSYSVYKDQDYMIGSGPIEQLIVVCYNRE